MNALEMAQSRVMVEALCKEQPTYMRSIYFSDRVEQ